jgi:cell division septation protein DedD
LGILSDQQERCCQGFCQTSAFEYRGGATKAIPASAKTSPRAAGPAPSVSKGSYVLQVAALRTDADAMAVANDLRKKKFPAFVLAPQGDKYYRVQVGPYTDEKSVQGAKKGLESAGFKAIIKH